MSRIERIGGATLYLGDCREILPKLNGSPVLVTDPVWPNAPAGSVPGSGDPWRLWADFWSVMPPVNRAVVTMRCDSDPRFLNAVPEHFPFFRSIQMPYVMPGYLGRVLGGDETAYWFGSPPRSAPGRRVVPGRAPAAQPHDRRSNGHPMSRAQVHFDWLVAWCTDADECVLDPFMGSATTGCACAKLGRPFVGIEVDPRFFDLACRRIEDAHRQGDMLLREVV